METEADYQRRVIKSVRNAHRFIKTDLEHKQPHLLATSTLTKAELLVILQRQNYRCAETGERFWIGPGTQPTKGRIRHDIGYTASNVRIIHNRINAAEPHRRPSETA